MGRARKPGRMTRRDLIKALRQAMAETPRPVDCAPPRGEVFKFDPRQLGKYAISGHVMLLSRAVVEAIVKELERKA